MYENRLAHEPQKQEYEKSSTKIHVQKKLGTKSQVQRIEYKAQKAKWSDKVCVKKLSTKS